MHVWSEGIYYYSMINNFSSEIKGIFILYRCRELSVWDQMHKHFIHKLKHEEKYQYVLNNYQQSATWALAL